MGILGNKNYLQASHKDRLKNIMDAGSPRKLCCRHLFVLSVHNRLKAWNEDIQQKMSWGLNILRGGKTKPNKLHKRKRVDTHLLRKKYNWHIQQTQVNVNTMRVLRKNVQQQCSLSGLLTTSIQHLPNQLCSRISISRSTWIFKNIDAEYKNIEAKISQRLVRYCFQSNFHHYLNKK